MTPPFLKAFKASNSCLAEYVEANIHGKLFVINYSNTVNHNLAMKLMDSYSQEKGNAMVMKVITFAVEEYKSFLDALAGTDSEKTEELEIIEQ